MAYMDPGLMAPPPVGGLAPQTIGPQLLNLYQSGFQTIAILIMVVFLYNFIPDRIFLTRKDTFRVIVGLLFGFAAFTAVAISSAGSPGGGGIGINGIIIPLAGFVGGAVSALITTAILLITVLFLGDSTVSPPDLLIIVGTFLAIFTFGLIRKGKYFDISYLGNLVYYALLVSVITSAGFVLYPGPGSASPAAMVLEAIQIFGLIFFGLLLLGSLTQSVDRRKESEYELLSYREHLEALVQERTCDLETTNAEKNATIESTMDGIVVVSFDGAIRDFNTAADRILQISKERKRSGEPQNVLVLMKNRVTDRELLEHPVLTEPSEDDRSMETTITFRNGRIYDVFITPYRLDDRILGRILNFRDITDKKHAEESLRAYNQKLKLLSSIIRHDIQNQLMVITGYLEIAGRKETDPVKLGYIEKERTASDKIRELLHFTSDYQDLGRHEPVWLNAAASFGKACRSFSGSGISCTSGVSELWIFSDPLLDRVFYNLVDNSIRHGEHVRRVTLSAARSGDSLVIVYEDDGSGVRPEEKDKIFLRGYGKNTGFGMFLIREILSITGISIAETGTWGKGARFEIHVPPGKFRETAGSTGIPDQTST